MATTLRQTTDTALSASLADRTIGRMIRLALAVLPLALLAGCTATSTPTAEPTVSAACTDSITALAAVEQNTDGEDPAIIDSTNACTTVDEYIRAVKANPGSWLWKSPEDVETNKDLIIISACSVDPTTVMCQTPEAADIIKAGS